MQTHSTITESVTVCQLNLNALVKRAAIGHNILDFYVRELVNHS
jgi:hypothetical protein